MRVPPTPRASTPIDLRALYDNKFALLYKEDEELNDPAFQARKREEKQKRAQEIAAAPPLRGYCMQVKRQLEVECNGNMSGNLEIEIPEKIPRGAKSPNQEWEHSRLPTENWRKMQANPQREINGKNRSHHQ